MPLSYEASALAVILVAVVSLWVSERLPLPVTALLGAVACVAAGVAPAKEVFRPFAEPLVFLFIGSFILAEAIRVHGLDRRLAYSVLGVPWVGERPWRIMAAVATVSAVISAFISNTATTAPTSDECWLGSRCPRSSCPSSRFGSRASGTSTISRTGMTSRGISYEAPP